MVSGSLDHGVFEGCFFTVGAWVTGIDGFFSAVGADIEIVAVRMSGSE